MPDSFFDDLPLASISSTLTERSAHTDHVSACRRSADQAIVECVPIAAGAEIVLNGEVRVAAVSPSGSTE